jgi:hypothetical protein
MMAASPEEAGALIATMFAGITLVTLARAWAKRIENKPTPPKISPEVAERLERIERAVDSIALEVERISEGQRFVTKVLSDRGEIPKLPPVQH